MTTFSNISDVYRFLDTMPSFQVHGAVAARLGLQQIRDFCDKLGNPEKKTPFVHVAGTNGKGSVSAMLAYTYERAGYQCGLYTSPHMENVRERFRINRRLIPEHDLLRFFQRNAQEIISGDVSYFEITTAIAFWWFEDQKVDLAILETGLGGRLDATNIVDPEVSVITSIAHDHQNFLGRTFEKIAREKGGIIKKRRPLVIGNLPVAARNTVCEIAGLNNAPVWDARSLRPRIRFKKGEEALLPVFNFRDGKKKLEVASPGLTHVHRWNIAISFLVTRILQKSFPVTEQVFRESIQNITKSGLLPGRFEQMAPGIPWYFDGAHNPEAVRALTKTIKMQDWEDDPVIILSLMKDKAQKKMLEPFSVFKKNYYYTLNTERAADATLITPYLTNLKNLPPNEEEIIDFFTGLTKQVVIFTGSFYFYGIVKRWISRIIDAG